MKHVISLGVVLLVIGGVVAFQQGMPPGRSLSLDGITVKRETVTITSLMEAKDKYHGQAITLAGTILQYQEKVSRIGNRYTTFVLVKNPHAVTVHYRGHLGLRNQMDVKVEGTFFAVKYLADDVFYNEIDADFVMPIW